MSAAQSASPAVRVAGSARSALSGARPIRLVPVGAPSGRTGTAGFVASCAALLAVTLVGLLGLNVAVSGNAFVLDDLSSQVDQLRDREQALRVAVDREAAPQRLDARARSLGMVPAEAPVPLDLDGPGVPGPGSVGTILPPDGGAG